MRSRVSEASGSKNVRWRWVHWVLLFWKESFLSFSVCLDPQQVDAPFFKERMEERCTKVSVYANPRAERNHKSRNNCNLFNVARFYLLIARHWLSKKMLKHAAIKSNVRWLGASVLTSLAVAMNHAIFRANWIPFIVGKHEKLAFDFLIADRKCSNACDVWIKSTTPQFSRS